MRRFRTQRLTGRILVGQTATFRRFVRGFKPRGQGVVLPVPGEPQGCQTPRPPMLARRHENVRPRRALVRARGGRPAARDQSGWAGQVSQAAVPGAGCIGRCWGARGGMWYRASISGSLTGRAHAMVTSVHVLRDVALGTSNMTDAHHTQVAVQPGILAQCESISLFTSDSSKSWPRPVHVSHAWPRRPSAGCHRAVGRF